MLVHPGPPDHPLLPCHLSVRGARSSAAPGRHLRPGRGVPRTPCCKPPCASRSSSSDRTFCMCSQHCTSHLFWCSSVVFCLVTRPLCGHLGRGVSCGSVGVSDGYIKGSVTIPYTFLGAGSPLALAAAARKTEIVSTKQDDLWRKQLVGPSTVKLKILATHL